MRERIKNMAQKAFKKAETLAKTDLSYIVKGGFWLGIGQLTASGSSLILTIVFAFFLPKEVYGNYKYIISILSILSIASLSGIDSALAQAAARNLDGSFKKGITMKLRWGTLGSIAGIGLAVYYYLSGNATLAACLLITSVLMPFLNAWNLYGSYLSGKKKFREYVLLNNLLSQIGVTTCLIVTSFLTKDLFILVTVFMLSNTVFNWICLQKTLRDVPPNGEEDEETLSYAKHLSAMDLINTVSNQLDKILIFHFLGAAELAIYTIAFAASEQIKALLKNVNSLAMPKFATRAAEEIRKALLGKMILLGSVTILCILSYILLAPFLFTLLFPKYIESVIYSQVFAVSLIGIILSSFLQTLFQAKTMTKALYHYNIWSNISNIILLAPLIYFFGLWGAVFAKLINRFFLLGISTYIARKI